MGKIICIKLKKQDVAVHIIIQTHMSTATMKLRGVRWAKKNANRQAITWLASTEEGAII